MRVRFTARDLATGSLVEAAIDDFRITNIVCSPAFVIGDVNGDGLVNATDLGILLNAWGSLGGPSDLDQNGVVNAADLAILVNAWT